MTKDTTPKPKQFIRLPNNEAVRPRIILRLIPCGPDTKGDEWMTEPTIKVMMAGKMKAVCKFKNNESRDAAMEKLVEELNA